MELEMKNLVWLLFLPGSLCSENPLKINPDSLVTWKGSCLLIPCQISTYKGAALRDISLLWYFQPFFDTSLSEYSGHLLYNSSSTPRNYGTQSQSASARRFEFVGNLEKRNCSLKISQVQPKDSGIYGARLFASYSRPVQHNKWFFSATVHVAGSPPTPKMDISPKDIPEGWTTVTCSVTHHCPEESLRLTIAGIGEPDLFPQNMTINDGVIQTVVSFQVTWEDHMNSLACFLVTQDGISIAYNTLELDVKYAPKDVRLIASPGTSVREGEMLSLECMIESCNPEVSEYHWYKDDQVMDEWKNHEKIEFEAKGDQHSGAYRCEAKNSAGTQKSEELIIDVQSHLHYPSAPAASGAKPTTASEGPQSSSPLPSTPEGASSPLPSTFCPPSLSELLPSQCTNPPLPSSQTPCDGRTLWEEFSFLSESQNQAVKAKTQFIHSCKDLTSAVVHLTEQFRKALLQIRQRARRIPREKKKP